MQRSSGDEGKHLPLRHVCAHSSRNPPGRGDEKGRAVRKEVRPRRGSSRREFLKAGSVVVPGLVIGFYLPEWGAASALHAAEQPTVFAPNAFLRIGSDNIVTVISKHIEVKQGAYTGLATLLAEDWSQVRVEPAPADDDLYKNLRFGSQATCCSASILNSFDQYRHGH
jgi:isoquinoline 1-oxidoreductase subunit beta